eukprot:gene5095-6989_t
MSGLKLRDPNDVNESKHDVDVSHSPLDNLHHDEHGTVHEQDGRSNEGGEEELPFIEDASDDDSVGGFQDSIGFSGRHVGNYSESPDSDKYDADEDEQYDEDCQIEFSTSDMQRAVDLIEDRIKRASKSVTNFQRREPEPPLSYQVNSEKEIKTLAIVRNFEQQYKILYKQRKPLRTVFPNECGVEKFICTTIRPNRLPYEDFDRHETISAFVADYIAYDQLENPVEMPNIIPSPTYTLWHQHGNAFDMSILLCSMLEGSGFDAYCVSGYASREVTTVNRLRTEKLISDKPVQKHTLSESKTQNKYAISRENRMESKYLKEMRERQQQKGEDILKEQMRMEQEELRKRLQLPADELYGLRVHSWVLVLPSKRGIHESFFIEPTTGHALFPDDSNYLGIEFIWNSKNLWVNMQNCANGLSDMDYDLSDTTGWEYMFPPDDDGDGAVSVDLPVSWVSKLSISPQDFELRCPSGIRRIQLANEKVEIFADYLNEDGLVKRVKHYESEELKSVVSITHIYRHRKDMLLKYIYYSQTETDPPRHDYIYSSGHPFHVHRHCFSEEAVPVRRITFYHGARVDGLLERFEDRNTITETYRNRQDKLIMRQATFPDLFENKPGRRKRKVNINVERKPEDIEVMTETYQRTPLIPAHKDIDEIVYNSDAIQLRFHRGEGNISSSTLELEKPRTSDKQEVEPITDDYVDLYTPESSSRKPKNFELHAMLQKCLRMEKACLKSLGLSMRETKQICEHLQDHQEHVELEISFYDTVRNEKLRSERALQELEAKNEAIQRAKQAEDYLAPYLVRLENPDNIDEVTASWLKDQVMDDFTAQLKTRFNLIEVECNREAKELEGRTNWFRQNQPSLSEEEEREFAKYRNEALFRMNVLQKRLAQHKERTPLLSMQMEQRLRTDPRLAALQK